MRESHLRVVCVCVLLGFPVLMGKCDINLGDENPFLEEKFHLVFHVYSGVLMSPCWQWHHGLLFMHIQSVFSYISQMLLMSGVLIQLSLEKHMAQRKGFEIWRKPWKQDLPSVSRCVKLKRCSVCDPFKGWRCNCSIMLQTWEFVTFCHGHSMALLPVLWIRNL